MAVDSVLRGSGDMKIFTIANLVNLSVRVIIAVTMAPRFGIAMVWYAVPVGWFLKLGDFLQQIPYRKVESHCRKSSERG